MKNILFVLIAFLLGFSLVLGIRYLRIKNTPPFVPETSHFQLNPPSEAVSGTLTIIKGSAEKLSRTDTDYKEASSGAQILLGESIATRAYAAAVASISGIATISIGPNAELGFANLFPDNMVLQQKNGKIEYQITRPLSVRALHSLISIDSGTSLIHIIGTDLSLTVTSGSAKLAIVDTDNATHVYELQSGERANIDDAAREVFLVRER